MTALSSKFKWKVHKFFCLIYSSWHLSLQVALPQAAQIAESSESTSLVPHGHFMLMTSISICLPILSCSLISGIGAGDVVILFPADCVTLYSALVVDV